MSQLLSNMSIRTLLGIAIRMAVLVPILVAGFGLLFLLQLGQQIRNGGTVLPGEIRFYHLIALAAVVTAPVIIVVAIGEGSAALLYGMTRSVHAVILGVPLTMGFLGSILAMAVFNDPEIPDSVTDRLFTLGGMLLFFLGGSLQVWAWQQWTQRPVPSTPITWYAVALVITAGFLGTMIAWRAPSPYVRAIDQYYQNNWQGKHAPALTPSTLSNDVPIF
ncbi:hypothetical protein K2X85_02660 [bacterium]|jgi:hypothetical protein|nr:hypothetical protein [bacterium]